MSSVNVQLTVRGDVPESSAQYALDKFRHLVSRRSDRVDLVHVVLAVAGNPAHEAPVSVEAEAEVAGARVHAHATAAMPTEAIDDAVDRLRRRLTDLSERPRSRRHTGRARSDITEQQHDESADDQSGDDQSGDEDHE
jgi:ribosome-associated translation inhibitor RaiA